MAEGYPSAGIHDISRRRHMIGRRLGLHSLRRSLVQFQLGTLLPSAIISNHGTMPTSPQLMLAEKPFRDEGEYSINRIGVFIHGVLAVGMSRQVPHTLSRSHEEGEVETILPRDVSVTVGCPHPANVGRWVATAGEGAQPIGRSGKNSLSAKLKHDPSIETQTFLGISHTTKTSDNRLALPSPASPCPYEHTKVPPYFTSTPSS